MKSAFVNTNSMKYSTAVSILMWEQLNALYFSPTSNEPHNSTGTVCIHLKQTAYFNHLTQNLLKQLLLLATGERADMASLLGTV